jgi:hypothetical protein
MTDLHIYSVSLAHADGASKVDGKRPGWVYVIASGYEDALAVLRDAYPGAMVKSISQQSSGAHPVVLSQSAHLLVASAPVPHSP